MIDAVDTTACTNPAPVIPTADPPPVETKPSPKQQAERLKEALDRTSADLESKRAELSAVGRRLAERVMRVALGHQEPDAAADQADQQLAATLRAVIGPQEAALHAIERRHAQAQRDVAAGQVAEQIAAWKQADQLEQDAHRSVYPSIEGFEAGLGRIAIAKRAVSREYAKLSAMHERGLITLTQLSDATHRPTQRTPEAVSSRDRLGAVKPGFERTPGQQAEGLRERLDLMLGELATGAQEAPTFLYRFQVWRNALANAGGADAVAAEFEANDSANESLITD